MKRVSAQRPGAAGSRRGRRERSAGASYVVGHSAGPGARAAAPLVVSFIYLESDVYFICARRACLRREDLPSKALNVYVCEAGPGAP